MFFNRRAKLLLRKKRFQEQLLDTTDGQLENLERMIHDLEFSQVELQVNFTVNNGQEFDPFTNNIFQGTVTISIYFNSLYAEAHVGIGCIGSNTGWQNFSFIK